MLDHVFLSVSDIERSIAFYVQALAPLGIADRVDYDGKDGPPGHPDLKGFGCKGRIFFWLRLGVVDSRAAHVGFIAKSQAEVDAAYAAAMAAGATDNGKPGARLYYDPRYYAGNVFDPDAGLSHLKICELCKDSSEEVVVPAGLLELSAHGAL